MPTPPQTPYPPPARPPKLTFDWREWLPYLVECEGTEEQKRELIQNLWTIIQSFVDFGWEIVARGAKESCGQDIDLAAVLAAAVVQSEEQQKKKEEA